MVAIHRYQNSGTRVRDPFAARLATEPSEDFGMNYTQPGAGEHGDGQLGDHGQVQRHPVAGLKARKVLEQRRELIHPDVKLLVSEGHIRFFLRLRHPDDGGLIPVVWEVTVDAVVAGIDPPADKPTPAGSVAGVESRMPVLVPRK